MEKKTSLFRRALLILLALAAVLLAAVFALWHNEISTLLSIEKLNTSDDAHQDGSVYQMTVSGGYYFDEYLSRGGASTDKELIDFITGKITKPDPHDHQRERHLLFLLYRGLSGGGPAVCPELRLLPDQYLHRLHQSRRGAARLGVHH